MSKQRFATLAAATAAAAIAAMAFAGTASAATATSPAAHSTTQVGIEASTPLMINNTNKTLVVTGIDTSQDTVKDHLFDGVSPQVGDIIEPGGHYTFTWIEYFFGSEADVTFRAQDGSGTIRTRTGMDVLSGFGYGCDQASGSLACADDGTNPSSWQNNVEIVNH